MKIFHIEFAKTGTHISGGEKVMLEQIKFFKKKGIKNVLLTTDNGKAVYTELGLHEDDLLEYKVIDSHSTELKRHIFISYILRTITAKNFVKDLEVKDDDVLFCHSDFFPNFIPFYFLAKKNNKAKLFYWFHMLSPDVFKGFEGHFTGKLQRPKFNTMHYKLNQYFYNFLAINRGTILTVNSYYKEILEKKYHGNTVYLVKHFGGTDVPVRPLVPQKVYDVAWMGRFHPQKGLPSFIKILQSLKKHKPDVSALVLGGGNNAEVENFKKAVTEANLENNVKYKGFISGREKYELLEKAKVFLMTSLYESFGIVNLEAMSCGLPVIAYDLPVYHIFSRGMLKVPLLKSSEMTSKTLWLLQNEPERDALGKEAKSFSENFSWEKMGEEVLQLIEKQS